MKFREMIKQVQLNSGFSDKESQEALVYTVACIAERLTQDERKDFASQLPKELKQIVLAAERVPRSESILDELMNASRIKNSRAKKQLLSSWDVIKQAVSAGEIEDIRAQLPNKTAALLH